MRRLKKTIRLTFQEDLLISEHCVNFYISAYLHSPIKKLETRN